MSHRDAEDAELACQIEPRYLKAHGEGGVTQHHLWAMQLASSVLQPLERRGYAERPPSLLRTFARKPWKFWTRPVECSNLFIGWSIMAQALCRACPTDLLREQAKTCVGFCFA